MILRFKKYYRKIIIYDLLTKFNYTNLLQVPRLSKIVVHLTHGDFKKNQKSIIIALIALEIITGQKSIITRVKKSIAGFEIQRKMKIGSLVTLRNTTMYQFLDKLITLILPKIKDFSGISFTNSNKNINTCYFGLNDIFLFPEIEAFGHSLYMSLGLDILIVTTATTKIETKALLSAFQLPFV